MLNPPKIIVIGPSYQRIRGTLYSLGIPGWHQDIIPVSAGTDNSFSRERLMGQDHNSLVFVLGRLPEELYTELRVRFNHRPVRLDAPIMLDDIAPLLQLDRNGPYRGQP